MVFKIDIPPIERAEARFVREVGRNLRKALARADEKARERGERFNQATLARECEIDRSVISRQLNGMNDMRLSTLARLAYAMGFHLEAPKLLEDNVYGNKKNERIVHARMNNVLIHNNDIVEQFESPKANSSSKLLRKSVLPASKNKSFYPMDIERIENSDVQNADSA